MIVFTGNNVTQKLEIETKTCFFHIQIAVKKNKQKKLKGRQLTVLAAIIFYGHK